MTDTSDNAVDENGPLAKEFGKYIKLRRKVLGASQDDIADRAKIARATLSTIERGKRLPRLDHFIRLCQVLYLSPGKFIDDWEGEL